MPGLPSRPDVARLEFLSNTGMAREFDDHLEKIMGMYVAQGIEPNNQQRERWDMLRMNAYRARLAGLVSAADCLAETSKPCDMYDFADERSRLADYFTEIRDLAGIPGVLAPGDSMGPVLDSILSRFTLGNLRYFERSIGL